MRERRKKEMNQKMNPSESGKSRTREDPSAVSNRIRGTAWNFSVVDGTGNACIDTRYHVCIVESVIAGHIHLIWKAHIEEEELHGVHSSLRPDPFFPWAIRCGISHLMGTCSVDMSFHRVVTNILASAGRSILPRLD